jgi:hypothetical protein
MEREGLMRSDYPELVKEWEQRSPKPAQSLKRARSAASAGAAGTDGGGERPAKRRCSKEAHAAGVTSDS